MRKKLLKTKNNIRLLLFIKAISALAFGWSIVNVLYFTKNNISYTDIGYIFALETILIILSSLPFGFISDNISRKIVILTASISGLISMSILIMSPNIYGAYYWAIFSGISFAATTGSFESMFYENLKFIKKSNYFSNIYSYSYIIIAIIGSISAFLYPILFELNTQLPLFLGLLFSILMFFTSLFIYEERGKKISIKNIKQKKKTIFKYGKLAIFRIFQSNKLLWLASFDAFWLMGIWIYEELLVQPFLELNYTMLEYGIIFSIAMLIQAFLINFFIKIFKNINFNFKIIGVVLSTFIILYLSEYFQKNIFFITFLIGFILTLKNYILIIISDKTNKEIKRDYIRNTIFSYSATLSLLIYAIFLPIIGYLMEMYGITYTIFLNNFFFLIIGILLILMSPYYIRKK